MKLLDFQEEPAAKLAENIRARKSTVLLGMVGSGKTYVANSALLNLLASGQLGEQDWLDPEKMLLVMPSSCKTKFNRVCQGAGLENYRIQSYNELIYGPGELYIDWDVDVTYYAEIKKGQWWVREDGTSTAILDERAEFTDKKDANDLAVKFNQTASDGMKAKAAKNTHKHPNWRESTFPEVLFLDESQMVKNEDALRTKTVVEYIKCVNEKGWKGCVVFCSGTPFSKIIETKAITMACFGKDEKHWKDYAWGVAGFHIEIDKPSEAASGRFKEKLEDHDRFIEITGVEFKHRAFTKNHFITLDKARREIYDEAFNEYQLARLEAGKNALGGRFAALVASGKFRKTSEHLRADDIGEFAEERSRFKGGRQIIVASNFLETLDSVAASLQAKGVPKEKIAFLTGSMNPEQKQVSVDGFQTGRFQFLLMTLRTGGVGLSLDNDGEFPGQLPREIILPPTWSPIELTQALGRAHRVLTVSTTRQWIVWCKDTVEDKVAARVEIGLKSIKKLLTKKISWITAYDEVEEKTETAEEQDRRISEMLFGEVIETEDGVEEDSSNVTDAMGGPEEDDELTVTE